MTAPTNSLAALTRVNDLAERALGWLLVVLMGVMVIDVVWQVASRFLLRAPSSFTEELAGFLLVWIGVVGAAYGLRKGSHPGIDLLVTRLRGPVRRTAPIVTHLLVAAFALSTMVIGGSLLVRLAFQLNQISAAMGIRVGFVYLALPLTGMLMIAFSIEGIVKAVSATKGR